MAQLVNPQTPVRFLSLGDSYTIGQSVTVNQRWPVQLMDSLAERGFVSDTLNIIATTGWRTDNLLTAIENRGLASHHYNLVSILIGVNNQYQNRPISQYMTEFPQLLDSAIRYAGGDTSHVFIVSIPDYAYTPYGQNSNPAQISAGIDQYNQINRQFAQLYGITYFDVTPISRQGVAQPALVASDGLHPSGLQYSAWVTKILHYVDSISTTTNLPERKQESMFSVFPNPATDKITVQSRFPLSGAAIEVYNSIGRLLIRCPMHTQNHTIELSHLSPGLYYAKLIHDGKTSIQRVVLE